MLLLELRPSHKGWAPWDGDWLSQTWLHGPRLMWASRGPCAISGILKSMWVNVKASSRFGWRLRVGWGSWVGISRIGYAQPLLSRQLLANSTTRLQWTWWTSWAVQHATNHTSPSQHSTLSLENRSMWWLLSSISTGWARGSIQPESQGACAFQDLWTIALKAFSTN